eukprot:GFYU01000734.1.p1 GENE.GFYU01000734.1~~GFYU01000734.1.p1  ORF type:complete len:1529 (-),score=557.19 GFYU01000734.1:343-4929(-)
MGYIPSLRLLASLIGLFLCIASTNATINNYIVMGSRRFATLDDALVYSNSAGSCQNHFLPIPSGWILASNDALTKAAALSGSWESECLVLAGGAGVPTQGNVVCDEVLNGLLSSGNTYKVSECSRPRKIFIEQPMKVGDVDSSIVDITNWIVFQGQRFGVLDNTVPGNENPGCQETAFQIPSGWAIADPSPKTFAVLLGQRYTFGTTCVVLSDGSSYHSDSGSSCGSDELVSHANRYTVKTCNRRVLITGAASQLELDTWDTIANITNVCRVRSYLFATIDNAHPTYASSGCTDVVMQIPDGWRIASRQEQAEAAAIEFAAVKGSFGTNCLVLADGSSIGHDGLDCCVSGNCPSQLLTTTMSDGLQLYASHWCTQRIMIVRDAPKVGHCQTWGDPHFLTFDGLQYSYFGIGEYWLVKTDLLEVQLRTFMTGTASSISAVTMKECGPVISIYTNSGDDRPTVRLDGNVVPVFADQPYTLEHECGEITVGCSGIAEKGTTATDSWDETYLVTFGASGTQIRVIVLKSEFGVQFMHVYVTVQEMYFQGTDGLCGTFDFDVTNEMTGQFPLGSPQVYGPLVEVDTVHDFAHEWRITQAESLFWYEFGKDTSTFTTATFVPVYENIWLTEADRLLAIEKCTNLGLTGQFLDACIADVAATHSAQLAVLTGITEDINDQNTLDTAPECPTATITHFISHPYVALDYALLDGTNPYDPECGCQDGPFAIPDGWRLAEDNPVNRAALLMAPWGTPAIVFANGNAYGVGQLTLCGENMLIRSGTCGECIAVRQCDARILIVRDNEDFTPMNNEYGSSVSWEPYGTQGFALDEVETFGAWYEAQRDPNDLFPDPEDYGTSFFVTLTTPGMIGGAKKTMALNQELKSGFRIGAWSKCIGVTGSPDSDYSIYVDLAYTDGDFVYAGHESFNVGTHDWEYKAFDVYPKKPVHSVTVYLLFRVHTGQAWFDNIEILPPSGNLARNPSFDNFVPGEDYVPHWTPYTILNPPPPAASSRYVTDTDIAVPPTVFGQDGRSVKLDLSQSGMIQGSNVEEQGICQGEDGCAIVVGGWCKGEDVEAGAVSRGLSVIIDVYYQDEEEDPLFGQIPVTCPTGSYDWTYEFGIVYTGKPVKEVWSAVIFDGSQGSVKLDHAHILPTFCHNCTFVPGVTYGDPHMVTLDGHMYDLQAIGEFTLVQDGRFEVQVRHAPAGDASVNSAVAIGFPAGNEQGKITITRSEGFNDPVIKVNSRSFMFGTQRAKAIPGGFGTLIRSGTLNTTSSLVYTIKLTQSLHEVEVSVQLSEFKVQFIEVFLKLPQDSRGMIRGLLGNFNGDPSDDFITREGRRYNADKITDQELYEEFAYSWRVGPRSLFDYNAGESTKTFTKEAMPTIRSISDFPSDKQAEADVFCGEKLLSPKMHENCMFDYLTTGDPGFARKHDQVEWRVRQADRPLHSRSDKNSLLDISLTNPERVVWFLWLMGAGLAAIVVVIFATLFVLKRHYNKRMTVAAEEFAPLTPNRLESHHDVEDDEGHGDGALPMAFTFRG